MNWYCIHTRPLKEAHTARYLADTLGLETYFPRLRQVKKIRRVKREVLSPLFPRYLFCRFDPTFAIRAVRYAPDVLDVVNFGGVPTIVSDSLISDLRSWAGESLNFLTIHPGLRIGDTVEITSGPMRGLQAIILQNLTDSDRVAVLLSTLHYQARIIIDRVELERAS